MKTRLAATIGNAQATRFYVLATTATAAVARSCESVLLPYWAVAEIGAGARSAWPEFEQIAQGDGDLGARLHQVYSRLQARHGRVLLIGGDTPQVTPALLRRALAALNDNKHPFVLGPATDGGFWLFGGRQPVPRSVWLDVHYSQADTARDLCAALAAECGTTATLAELRDVDEAEDLRPLAESLAVMHDPLPAQRDLMAWLPRVTEQFSPPASST